MLAQSGISVIDQGLPTLTGFLKSDLGLSAGAAGLAVSSFVFGRAFGSYAAGVAADRLGEKRVLIAGGVASGALVALAAASPVPFLFILISVAGTASAVATPAGGRLVLVAFPRRRHGLALGLRQTGIPIGGLVGAAALPAIAHVWGWRWSLVVAGAAAVLTVVPLGLWRSPHAPDRPTRACAPGISPLRDRNIRLLTAWGCLFVSGQYALLAFLALDLHQRSGLALATGSLLVAVAQFGGLAGRIVWGAISDRLIEYGRKPLLLTLTAVGIAGTVALLVLPSSASTVLLVACVLLAGIGVMGFQGLFITLVAEMAGPGRVGAATGFSVTFLQITIVAATPLYGLVADAAGSYRAVWGALTAALVVSLIPALLVRER